MAERIKFTLGEGGKTITARPLSLNSLASVNKDHGPMTGWAQNGDVNAMASLCKWCISKIDNKDIKDPFELDGESILKFLSMGEIMVAGAIIIDHNFNGGDVDVDAVKKTMVVTT